MTRVKQLLTGFVLLFLSFASYANQTDAERYLSGLLTMAVKQLNDTTPMVLDEDTRLDSAATFDNYLIYNNTLTNYSIAQLDISVFDSLMLESVIKPLCDNKALEDFIKLKVVMVYRYLDKDGQFVSELSKDMSTCQIK